MNFKLYLQNMVQNQNTTKITIKISNIIVEIYIFCAIFLGLLTLLSFFMSDKIISPLIFALFSFASFVRALYLKSQSITIFNMDATYESWFANISIKNIESINIFGFWIINTVIITGRGMSSIQLTGVHDLDKVREVIKKIQNATK